MRDEKNIQLFLIHTYHLPPSPHSPVRVLKAKLFSALSAVVKNAHSEPNMTKL